MRCIRENNPPEALIRCLALRRSAGQAIDYDEVGDVEVDGQMLSVKAEIRKARIADQGGICAYTMMRIDTNSAHNEHLIPRSVSKDEGREEETLDYRNIVACFPKREEKGGYGFGAPKRGTLPLEVTPFDPSCEARMRFDRVSGRVEPTDPSDQALQEMLEDVLVLNHATLIARRLAAFEQAGISTKSQKPLSAAKARDLAREVLEFRSGSKLLPYCVAIAQAALAHAELVEKRSRRLKSKS